LGALYGGDKKVTQKKIDAICARILHENRLSNLKNSTWLVDVLAFSVPVGYMPFRLFAKGTSFEAASEFIWIFAASILAVLSAVKMVSGWSEKSNKHSKLMGENISLVTQADYLLSKSQDLDEEKANLFFTLADVIEKSDRELLGKITTVDRQEAYRQALKESSTDTENVKCPICNSSPWHFVSGSCQACGNTPKTRE